jgi:hypothetical protein
MAQHRKKNHRSLGDGGRYCFDSTLFLIDSELYLMGLKKQVWLDRIAHRVDLTTSVVHLTRPSIVGGEELTHIDILWKILLEKTIKASSTATGFICGDRTAVCFQDAPIQSIMQNLFHEKQYRNAAPGAKVRYMGAGLIFDKLYIYNKGGRPVIYDRTNDAKRYLPKDEWWRIVNFDLTDNNDLIDWTHEREWRHPGDMTFDRKDVTVLVSGRSAYHYFINLCESNPEQHMLSSIEGVLAANPVLF